MHRVHTLLFFFVDVIHTTRCVHTGKVPKNKQSNLKEIGSLIAHRIHTIVLMPMPLAGFTKKICKGHVVYGLFLTCNT